MKSITTLILAGATSLSLAASVHAHDLKHSHKGVAHVHHDHDGLANMESRHGKPSAPIQFNHKIDGEFSVGRFTDVIVTAREKGLFISLTANGTPDLEIGKVETQLFASGDEPTWRIAVRPKTEGVHYLNLFGVTKTEDKNFEQVRVESIRIDLGGQSKQYNLAQKPVLKDSAAGKVAVFKATETIE